MELLPNDKKVIDLLSKLKNSDGAYPSDILTARRQGYLRQVANIGLGIGVGAGLKNVAKSGNGAGTVATITSKILETALIAAIAIEAGAAAYLYRDKIADLIRNYTSSANVQEVAPPSDNSAAEGSELIAITESPSATAATPSATAAVTLSSTLAPVISEENNGTGSSVNATPDPGDQNGNQYGLTPKPERTKDPNPGNNNNDTSNDTGKVNNKDK